MHKAMLALRFTNFAENECKGSSDLYEFLALAIAKDDKLLELCTNARTGQPIPNLLFGAVHYLLLKGKQHKLKEFYPSIVKQPQHYNASFTYFKDFCLTNKAAIIHLLQTKLVQTNEVRRCAYLYPIFSYIYERTEKPLALIEIGTSAGLQLLWDKYAYQYNDNKVYGNLDSTLTITSAVKGDIEPFLQAMSSPVAARVGVDLNIVDLTDVEERLWLKALIWPNHPERLFLFEKAADYVKANTLQLINGDRVALLHELVKEVSLENTICIYHTHVANQMPEETKVTLLNTIASIGKTRDVFHIYNNVQDLHLHLDYYVDGAESKQTIAETDGHGRNFKWLL